MASIIWIKHRSQYAIGHNKYRSGVPYSNTWSRPMQEGWRNAMLADVKLSQQFKDCKSLSERIDKMIRLSYGGTRETVS